MSIEIQNITKTFGRFVALRDVSLTIPSGQLVALLGPSGSGKTTLLRIVAGLEHADPGGGAVRFHGQDVVARHARHRGVGFVFQHYALFKHMTVFDNIAFGLTVRPRRSRPSAQAIRQKVGELLGLIQLENLAGRYPSQLSGGQRQRVALARALAVEPEVLLLDEPFGALDARVRQELRHWLRRLHDQIHVTSLFVTHDQEEALEVADQVVVMNEGRIEQVGTPEAVFHHPANEFVLNFLGHVNVFHGRVQENQAVFGSLAVQVPCARAADGCQARLFVRPYDLEVHASSTGPDSLPATVLRVQSAGPVVKLELRTEDGQLVHVEISHEQSKYLNVHQNDIIYVRPKQSRVYVDDYSI
jgi:sulfate/thiosulfate transport system ATP-binding protein